MAKNRASFTLTADQLATLDAALSTMESVLVGLVSLTDRDRRHQAKMGDRSEPFFRMTLAALAQHPEIVPPRLDVAEAMRDLQAVDALRPLLHRLARLTERTQDTDMALRADVMDAAMEGYALLKVSGQAMGLDGLRREIGARFARPRKAGAKEDTEAAPEGA